MKRLLICTSLLVALAAHAKLPAPVLTDEAKAKAAEAAARSAHGNKVAAFQLCRSMDRAASHYFKTASTSGKSVNPAQAAPACVDPGSFVPAAAAAPAPAKS